MMMIKLRRCLNKVFCKCVMNGVDLEGIVFLLGNLKFYEYFW